MPNPTIRIHNAETNETVDRAMTAQELKDYEANNEISENRVKKMQQDKIDRVALLDRIGITAEEAALLLP
jgi:hypothetical protein